MFYLFDKNHGENATYQSTRVPSMRHGLFRTIERELTRVKGHLRKRDSFVHADHILLVALRTFNIDPGLDLFDYHDKVLKNVDGVARSVGINTMLNTSMINNADSHFYGQDVTEVYLMVNDRVDLMSIEEDWENKSSITVLRHDITNVDLTPMSKNYSGGHGYAVLQIDLVLMMHQYRLWYLKQLRSNVEYLKPTTAFISNYVISNMMDSHFNMAMFNRLVALHKGTKVISTKTKVSFTINDFIPQLDRYLLQLIGILYGKQRYYGEHLKQIALLGETTALDIAMLPNVVTSRQTTWIYVLARINFLSFVLELDYDMGGTKNRRDANIIKRFFIQGKNSRLFDRVLGNIDSRALQQDIKTGILEYL